MKTLEKPVLNYTTINTNNDCGVVIVAAGSSTRMGGINKQFLLIKGVPVIVRTIKAFINAGLQNIVVVVKNEELLKFQNLLSKHNLLEVTDLVAGGKTRQDSVLMGVKKIKNKKYVLIHDGARPLVKVSDILKLIEALKEHNAVVLATKVYDTIKKIDNSGNIISTVSRDELLAVQTPQGFILNDYLNALNNLKTQVTDDASVMEQAGYTVYPIITDNTNIKITTPDDIVLAEMILSKGELA